MTRLRWASNLPWLQTWLTCVTFYYPAYWLALFLVHALPALVQVVLFHERLKVLQLSPFIARALSGPAATLNPTQYRQASDARALLEVVCIAIAFAILLAFFGRHFRLQAGLALALLGQVGMVTWLWRLLYRPSMSPQTIAVSAFFFGLMFLGLRWMLSAHGNLRYPARVGSLLADFVLPSAVAGMVFASRHYAWITRQAFRLLVPAVLASLLVSLLPPSRLVREPAANRLAIRCGGPCHHIGFSRCRCLGRRIRHPSVRARPVCSEPGGDGLVPQSSR